LEVLEKGGLAGTSFAGEKEGTVGFFDKGLGKMEFRVD
jgi:hypothetical protein